MSDPFAPAAADTQPKHLNPSRSARLGRYLMERAMILICLVVGVIAALMFAAWPAEPGLRITWRKGEGWTAHR